MAISIETSQNVDLEYEIAGVGDRILAQLVDYAVYLGWFILCGIIISATGGGGSSSIGFYVVMMFLPAIFYPILTEYFLDGQTLGKRALNIKVVRTDGNQPTLGAYILRWLLCLVDIQIASGIVAIICIAVNGKGQRLGDMAAGTTVIKLKKRVTLEEVTFTNTPENYKVSYPEAAQLSDNDIETIRQVLQKDNDELLYLTENKVKTTLDIKSDIHPAVFLEKIVNDYTHLANKVEEN